MKFSVEKNKASYSREQYQELKKAERQTQSLRSRELVAIRKSKENPRAKFSGVLGIETIIPQDDLKGMTSDITKGDHAYGLDHRMFTSNQDKEEYHRNFVQRLKMLDAEIKLDNKKIETLKANGKLTTSVYKPVKEKSINESQKVIDEVLAKKNKLINHISELKEDQQILAEWLKELDDQQRIDISKG